MTTKKLHGRSKVWKPTTLAMRLSDCVTMLNVHGYLRDSEKERIRVKILRDWQAEESSR